MVADQRNPETEVQNRIVGAEVIGPEERLLPELDGSREEAEHRPQDRELQQHRKTATHRTDAGTLVEIHRSLLLLHRILLLRILLVQLVDFRLYGLHLGG